MDLIILVEHMAVPGGWIGSVFMVLLAYKLTLVICNSIKFYC